MAGLSDLEQRCVAPFYLTMMGLNAVQEDVPFDALRVVARATTDDEVAELLASHWRPRVMGAWLASGRIERLGPALLESLETSQGSLTAPPLAAVALHGLGARAVPSLMAYLHEDTVQKWGSASFVAAVLERLEATPTGVEIRHEDRRAVNGMLIVAGRMAAAEPDCPTDAAN